MKKVIEGFTLIELIIVISIVAIISGFGIVNYVGLRANSIFNQQTERLVADIRFTRERSRAQEDGKQWGVHLENPVDDESFYEIWKGDSYVLGTVVERVNLSGGVRFSDPPPGSVKDVIFSKTTGMLSVTSTIILESPPAGKSAMITLTAQGLVDYSTYDTSAGSSSAPTVLTSEATNVATSTATLNGSANPNGTTTSGWFRYSTLNPGACNDSFGVVTPSTSLGLGTSPVPYSEGISGLSVNTTYYY